MTEDPARLAAHQLGYVRVLLLRHDRRARTESIRERDESKLSGGPEDELLAHARQVHHQNARGGRELDGEVAIADRVQRVLRGAVEAEELCGVVPVDGVGRARQCRRPERQLVRACLAVRHPAMVALEHLEPGHHVVSECHWLGGLQVGKPRQYGFGLALGDVEQRPLEAPNPGFDHADLVAQPQPHVGRDLVVARAAGVQLLAGIANVRGQRRLDVHVNILAADRPLERACLYALADALEAGDNGISLSGSEDALLRQHHGVGDAALDVVAVQPLIKLHRGGEGFDEGIGRLAEAAGPEFLVVHTRGFLWFRAL